MWSAARRYDREENAAAQPKGQLRGFRRASPESVGLASKRTARLIRRARQEHSDALVILKDGKLVVDEETGAAKKGTAIFAMSDTTGFTRARAEGHPEGGDHLAAVADAHLGYRAHVAVRMRRYSDEPAKHPMAFSYRTFVKEVVDLADRDGRESSPVVGRQ